MWFCGLAVAALGIGIGGSSLGDQLRGEPESGRVLSCQTGPHLYGRWLGSLTTCEVLTRTGTVEMETKRWHQAGTKLSLRRIGDSAFDPALKRDEVWWLPGGLLIGVVAWRIGLPPRTDLSYGHHAASRARRGQAGRG
jgi:hypothetical protein